MRIRRPRWTTPRRCGSALAAEVAAAYIDLRAAQARKAVTTKTLETARGLLRLANDARAAGLGDDLDVAEAQAEVASAEAQLPPLEQQAAADRNQLTLLLAESRARSMSNSSPPRRSRRRRHRSRSACPPTWRGDGRTSAARKPSFTRRRPAKA